MRALRSIAMLLTGASFSLSAAAQDSSTLFTHVRVFDGSGAGLTQPTNVLIQGNKIVAIGANVSGSGATVIDGRGWTLMPGLIDNHVHLAMAGASQADLLDPKFDDVAIDAKARVVAQEMLMRGFTAVRDLGGPVFRLKSAIDKGKTEGPRIYPSGAMISQTSGHGDSRLPNEPSRRFFGHVSKGETMGVNYIADGRDEVLTATREDLRSGASQIKVMAGGGAASAYDPLDVTQYTLDEMKAAVEAADDWGTYVAVHAYTPKAVRRAIDAGVKCIEHGQLLDEATLKLLADRGIWLSLQMLDPAPPTAPENVREKKGLVIQGTENAFTWAKKYNVKLAWGTDYLFDPRSLTKQTQNMATLTRWFTPSEALKLVTHDNAELLALSGPRNPYPGKLGVVEPGALADLLLVEGDPTRDLGVLVDTNHLVVIMKDGKIYKNSLASR